MLLPPELLCEAVFKYLCNYTAKMPRLIGITNQNLPLYKMITFIINQVTLSEEVVGALNNE